MTIFNPQNGFKPLLPIYGFLTLILIPTFIILFSAQTSLMEWVIIMTFCYGFVALINFIAQKTTKYWIDGNSFFYKSLFLKGEIDISSIRKLEINATCWLSGKPATSNTKGIFIYFSKYEDTFITPENNEEVVHTILEINPSIEVVSVK